MADDLSPLAAALREVWFDQPASDTTGATWERVATAARERLSAAQPAAPAERPTCATCPYWSDYSLILPEDRTDGMGQCRRHAPKYEPDTADDWADTHSDDWCGDHVDMPAWIASRRAAT